MKPRPFRPSDLSRQAMIQGVTLSPDGETIVYTRRTIEKGKYRTRLWCVPWKGGRAEQLTFAEANDTKPGFSPNGKSLVFESDRKVKNGSRQMDGMSRTCEGGAEGPR